MIKFHPYQTAVPRTHVLKTPTHPTKLFLCFLTAHGRAKKNLPIPSVREENLELTMTPHFFD